jgi:hypothetical protein
LSTVQEWSRRETFDVKRALDLAYLTPLRIPLMNPVKVYRNSISRFIFLYSIKNFATTSKPLLARALYGGKPKQSPIYVSRE